MNLDQLLAKWLGTEGGAERANYQMFLTELTVSLGLPSPNAKGAGLGDYEFEAPVKSEAIYDNKGTKRIDLYKRDAFILEAKQSQLKPGEAAPDDPEQAPAETVFDLFGVPIGSAPAKTKPKRRYDRLMEDARLQAQRYALALPDDHATPPFLIVADIGRAFEVYFDFAGNGRGYRPFPDERGYRIALNDLASDALIDGVELTAADTLRAIWTDPASIDPRGRAARVTGDIARLLVRVAAQLEEDQRRGRADDEITALGIEATSLFLMRTLFCMFAEDVGLLPKDSFKTFLSDAESRSDHFWRSGLEELWRRMNDPLEANRYWSHGDAIVRYFNGNLFSGAKVYDLPAEAKNILRIAADQDWRAVEPAIFGTLLEQVLTPGERAKLGAHYTPRPYVQRLVQATIMDVVTPEWEAVLAEARAAADGGDQTRAIALAAAFHERLAVLRILDPACGTGNFLYVAMENLLRLESEVRQFVIGLGGALEPKVHPNQFLGLELNPRAAVIAELVLWIGWLRYRLANTPEVVGAGGEPVLPPLSNINEGTHGGFDAVLVRTATGEPDVDNPRRPPWPEADFIVGNPPFIGKGFFLRDRLGNEYVETLWAANTRVRKSADFVMHWWDRAAEILTRPATRLRRFGFVTTNSITQIFSRKVIEEWLANPSAPSVEVVQKLHLTLAIPDHPWTRATKDSAAVRIAMTVAAAGPGEGRLIEIANESGLDTDEPSLVESVAYGAISAQLSLNWEIGQVKDLEANSGLSNTGMLLAGQGFKVSAAAGQELRRQDGEGSKRVVRPYLGGRELLGPRLGRFVLDFHGISQREAEADFPASFTHVLRTVKPERDINTQQSRRENWWLFGRSNRTLRAAVADISRFIATTETAKHRVFQFVSTETVPDHMVITISLSDWADFGVLSSAMHVEFALELGGTLEDRPRYNKTVCFDPFPFPDRSEAVAEIAERLDAARRAALAENPALTMTGLYNFVAPIRDGTLPPEQEAAASRARAFIVAKLHDDLDLAVAEAYGWGDDWRRTPLPPAEIVRRLVALNAERAIEEAEGTIRWLRPDYQRPRFGGSANQTDGNSQAQ